MNELKESDQLSFFPVEKMHAKIITDWLQKEHVKPFFYGQGLKNTLQNLDLYVQGIKNNGDYPFDYWIAYIGNKPFGFLITSFVEGPYNPNDPIDKWSEEGKETITLDLLIGEEEFLGKGLAHRMIQEFLISKFPSAFRVLIDPEVSNEKAIHVYEKAGFKKIEKFPQQHDDPNLCWMMHLEMKQLISSSRINARKS